MNTLKNRLRDAAKRYRSTSRVNLAFRDKLNKIPQSIERWPFYTAVEEDKKLRGKKWNERYAVLRKVMRDNKNIEPKSMPSDANIQSNKYSRYYKGNVGKGVFFLQICGWIEAHELWMGAVLDTEYFQHSGILEQQKEFAGDRPSL